MGGAAGASGRETRDDPSEAKYRVVWSPWHGLDARPGRQSQVTSACAATGAIRRPTSAASTNSSAARTTAEVATTGRGLRTRRAAVTYGDGAAAQGGGGHKPHAGVDGARGFEAVRLGPGPLRRVGDGRDDARRRRGF